MKESIPGATVERLPRYLRCLTDMSHAGGTCSSEDLALAAGVTSAQVRKDFSYLGPQGTRGVGYDHESLRSRIRAVLGLTSTYPVVVVGAGNMGSALANHKGFESWGFEVVAVVDIDDEVIGTQLDDLVVQSMDALEAIISELGVNIGIIATPPSAAQVVANRLARAGIKSILNLAQTVLKTPDTVLVRRVDLSTELGILAFHLKE